MIRIIAVLLFLVPLAASANMMQMPSGAAPPPPPTKTGTMMIESIGNLAL